MRGLTDLGDDAIPIVGGLQKSPAVKLAEEPQTVTRLGCIQGSIIKKFER